MNTKVFALIFGIAAISSSIAQENYSLPEPNNFGKKSLYECLSARASFREFSSKRLSKQTLSNLLWSAFGINRKEANKRTAPSAMNCQEIDIYIAMENGTFKYIADKNELEHITGEDIRAFAGAQEFVKSAPVNLIYVADYSKMKKIASNDDKLFYSAADAGFIGENVYLFCASEGLVSVVRGAINKEELSKKLKLNENQKIVLAHSIGYPKE